MRTVWEGFHTTTTGSDVEIEATGDGVIKAVVLVGGSKVELKNAAGTTVFASAGVGYAELMIPFTGGLDVNITGASGEATVIYGGSL